MKKLLVTLCGILLFSSCNSSANTPDNLEATAIKVIRAFEQKDSATINQLIYKKQGLVIIHNPGAISRYEIINELSFDKPVPTYQPYEYNITVDNNSATDYTLKYETLPEFSCDTEEWDKTGFYCDTLKRDNTLSSIAKLLREFETAEEDEAKMDAEIVRFKEMEKNSHRIILLTDNAELTFHLTLIDGKWYLSIFDRVTKCDA